ncbi:hypothetical protein GYH30_040020 [Glycine max]|uniref:Pectate lyase superfamily protein domain-containing protein n=2 Tax=Glycine subgen. Soja TaxID=1462606 RepID=K7M6V4_SOYBN|nr:hypothetical protein GYH30_040020 [Glycine max]RZB68968.1 Polygalacturonase [Glycine soja]
MKMVFPHSMVTIALVLMLASYVKAHVGLFDIRKYGAIPNGDTTMDLQNAWRDACVSMTPSKVVVPSGKYKLRQIDFMGLIKLILRIRFGYINFLTLFGNGTFHGQGKMAWKQNNCAKNKNCKKLAMKINSSDGSKEVTILNVTCEPRHGISVGSLGKYSNEESVEDLTIKNCTLKNTNNGLRIKTWPSTPITSLVPNLHFEDIIMINVNNPIIIGQEYCPWNQCSI